MHGQSGKQLLQHLHELVVIVWFHDVRIAARLDQSRVAMARREQDDRMVRSALGALDFPADVETVHVRDQVLDQCQIGTASAILLKTGYAATGQNDADGGAAKKSSDSGDASRVIVDQ